MASGGWGYAPNPFAQNDPAGGEDAERPQAAYGAWGGGVGTVQSGEVARAAPAAAAAPRGAGFLANFGRKEPAAATVPPSTFQISNGAGGSGREADLARREAELARREAEVQQLAADAKPRVSANLLAGCSQ